jgi:hypothetical protein
MSIRIPADVRAGMIEIAHRFGRLGGKKAAKNMTREECLARAKKAAKAGAEQWTAKRLAREGLKRDKQAAKRKRSAAGCKVAGLPQLAGSARRLTMASANGASGRSFEGPGAARPKRGQNAPNASMVVPGQPC